MRLIAVGILYVAIYALWSRRFPSSEIHHGESSKFDFVQDQEWNLTIGYAFYPLVRFDQFFNKRTHGVKEYTSTPKNVTGDELAREMVSLLRKLHQKDPELLKAFAEKRKTLSEKTVSQLKEEGESEILSYWGIAE